MTPDATTRTCLLAGALVALASATGAAQGFTPGPSAPAPRAGHGAAYDAARQRLVIFGGGCGDLRSDTWEYDAAAQSFTPGPMAPPGLTPRTDHAMAYDAGRGRVVLFGGRDASGPRNDTWEYDGQQWIPGPAAPAGLTPRQAHVVAYRSAGAPRTILFGGRDASGLRNDTWEYDGVAWTQGGPPHLLLLPREAPGMAYDAARDRVVLFGGRGLSALLGDTWEYDGSVWRLGGISPALLTPRQSHVVAYDAARQRIVLFGGNEGLLLPSLLNDTWEYGGAGWSQGPAAPAGLTPRQAHVVAYDAAAGRTLVFGGDDGVLRNDTWAYDGTGWALQGPVVPTARSGAAMAFHGGGGRNRSVLFGGNDPSGLRNDTWEFDGTAWAPGPAAPASLTPRQAHVVAHDSFRGRTVLFGGDDGTRRNDTWEYDGTAWVPGGTAPAALTPRRGHAMSFDAGRRRMVMIGGNDGARRNDTWEYDGTWLPGPAAPAGLTPRQAHVVAYDAFRGRTVLFGGDAGTLRNDTWEYDGSQWAPGAAAPVDLTPRQSHVVAYDAARARVVLFGGDDGTRRNDTWEYDGLGWYPGPAPPAGLTPRQAHVVAYDAARGSLVTFGGDDGCLVGDTWLYLGALKDSFVAGAGFGAANENRVAVFDALGSPAGTTFLAYASGAWGSGVAAGSIDAAPFPRLVTGPGPGPTLGPQVRAFGRDGSPLAKVNFFAYATLRYGAGVACGSLDGDAWDEIVTGAGPSPAFGPHVRAFDYDGSRVAPVAGASFFAHGTPSYGASVGSGDVDGDGRAEILAVPGPGPTFAAHVRGFGVTSGAVSQVPGLTFWAFTSHRHGGRVEAADADEDGRAEMGCAAGPGPTVPSQVRGYAYDASAVTWMLGFDVTPFATSYGATAGMGDVGSGAAADLLTGAGRDPAAAPVVRSFRYHAATLASLPASFDAFPGLACGVNVTAAPLGF